MVKPIQLMIIGVQKAGTSSLLRYLAQHPDIRTHSQPEMTFFLQDREYSRGYEWAYAKYFAFSAVEQENSVNLNRESLRRDFSYSAARNKAAAMDTLAQTSPEPPDVMNHNRENLRRDLHQNPQNINIDGAEIDKKPSHQNKRDDGTEIYKKSKKLIAKNVMVMHSPNIMHRIYEHNPRIQLVVLLREPVARAYSAYWWARRRGWETLKTFEEALAAEEARLKEGWFKWRQCAYRYNSTYYPHVKNLIEKFDAEQLHFIFTENLKDNALAICQALFSQLGIFPGFEPVIAQRHNQAAMPRSERFNFLFTQFLASHNPLRRAIRKLVPDATAYKLRKAILSWNDKPWTPPPIAPETHQELRAYFQPFNQQLAELLGKDLTHWDTVFRL